MRHTTLPTPTGACSKNGILPVAEAIWPELLLSKSNSIFLMKKLFTLAAFMLFGTTIISCDVTTQKDRLADTGSFSTDDGSVPTKPEKPTTPPPPPPAAIKGA